MHAHPRPLPYVAPCLAAPWRVALTPLSAPTPPGRPAVGASPMCSCRTSCPAHPVGVTARPLECSAPVDDPPVVARRWHRESRHQSGPWDSRRVVAPPPPPVATGASRSSRGTTARQAYVPCLHRAHRATESAPPTETTATWFVQPSVPATSASDSHRARLQSPMQSHAPDPPVSVRRVCAHP